MTNIRSATPSDRATILSIGEDSGLFAPEEVGFFADDFDSWSPGGDDPRLWLLAEDGSAAAQVAPEPMSDAVWNLLFIATHPTARRKGRARALINRVEEAVRAEGGRLLLIDTASVDDQAPARAAYVAAGYGREAVIRDYYGDGVDRVTFRKRL
ncbi:MAG: GNAT family N-acetyltransferase [Pseudomonadota bacterium]